MQPKVKKAVFPVAGLGTRFLPATKASPKEMLPVVDKPLIQYAVEEAVAAGIETLIFITGRNKRAIEDHFDKAYELETELEKAGKQKMLEIVSDTVPEAECVFVRQREALGLGHAVHCAHSVIGNEPFAVLLADDMIHNEQRPVLKQMIEAFEKHPCSIVAVEEVPPDETHRYGIVSVSPFNKALHKVNSIVEKPKPAEAPSNLAVVGRYVLAPRIMDLLSQIQPGAGGEIQLTDAIAQSLDYESVFAYQYDGVRYDCGSKLGYLMANVEMGLKHEEVGDAFRAYLKSITSEAASN